MIKTFDDFWNACLQNDLWYDQVKYRFSRKNIKQVAENAYISLIADSEAFKVMDSVAFRKVVTAWLIRSPDEITRPQLHQDEPAEQVTQTEPPLTGEARKAKIAEWLRTIGGGVTQKVPALLKDQIKEQGQTDPPKPRATFQEFDPERQMEIKKEMDERTRKGRELYFRENYPGASEEQVRDYLNGFEI